MPVYEMFDLIANSAVGNLGNMGLVILQLYVSMFFEIKFLFDSMKHKPLLVKVSVSMIPLVLIATYSIACGIIFSSFLGNGPTPQAMKRLVLLTLTREGISGIMMAVAAFVALMLLYSAVHRLKPHQWLMTFGTELLMALSLLALYGGLFVEGFPFTILDLCARDLYLARFPIYGYFTLLFKCCVLILSLLLGLLLREGKAKAENEEEKYRDWRRYNEKKVFRFLTQNDLSIGISTLIFGLAATVFVTGRMLLDPATVLDAETILTMLPFFALFLAPVVFGVALIHRVLRPRTVKTYRQLIAMGDKDTVLRLFCEEMIDAHPAERKLQWNDTVMRTAHFSFRRQGIRTWVEWRGERLGAGEGRIE